MIDRIRKLLVRFVFKVIPPEYFVHAYNTRRESNNKSLTTSGSTTRFTPTAAVFNMPGKVDKIAVGIGTVVEGDLLVFNYGGSIVIGRDSYVGRNSVVWSGENVTIGDNVLISHNVNISDTSAHEFDHLERADRFRELLVKGHPFDKASIQTAPIVIEDYVWINPYSIIIKGVRIGKGAIVAAGSVVTSDVEPFTMVAGNPARVVRQLEKRN